MILTTPYKVKMRVNFSNRAYAAILSETLEKINTETGGLFLGYVENDEWYIVETIDPGPKSIFQYAYFEYDREYTQHLINKIANLYKTRVSLIGLWHRHPGSFDKFSSTDDITNKKYSNMRKEGAISALVNIDPKFRLTIYHVDEKCNYKKIEYRIGNQYIPEKNMEIKISEYENKLNSINCKINSNNTTERYKLPEILDHVTLELEEIPESNIKQNCAFKPIIQNNIIDEVIQDIYFLTENFDLNLLVENKDGVLKLLENDSNCTFEVLYTHENDLFLLKYRNKFFRYSNGVIQKTLSSSNSTAIRELLKGNRIESSQNNFKKGILINNEEQNAIIENLYLKGNNSGKKITFEDIKQKMDEDNEYINKNNIEKPINNTIENTNKSKISIEKLKRFFGIDK